MGYKKQIWLLAIILFSLPFVSAAPVTDLNLFLVNPPAIQTKDLNFGFTWTGGDVNVLYWQFDTDGNVLVSGSDLNVIFSDDFETGGFTDDWNVVSGSWSQNGGALRTGDDGAVIYHEQQLNNLEVSFEFTGKFSGAGGTALSYAIINETTPGGTEEGYQIQILPAGEVRFNNRTNGSNINRITSSETISADTNYTVKATRASNGFWTLFLDGMEIGSAHDSNHTDFPFSSLSTNGTPTEFLYWDVQLEIGELNPISSPAYQSHTFADSGSKTIQVTAQNPDGNASTSLTLSIAADNITPTIIFQDFNFSNTFTIGSFDFNANYGIGCNDNVSVFVDVNVTNNDVNVLAETITVDTNTYRMAGPLFSGPNQIIYSCSDGSGNVATTSRLETVGAANFFFVYDNSGVALSGSGDYASGDVNSVVVYSLDGNESFDLFSLGAVSFNFVGDANSALDIRIGYNDETLVTASRTFDLGVLDTNSVPVCFYGLQPFFQQLLFSSVERDVSIRNATNGCYHVAATTKYAANDFFSLYAYTIPLSYFLRIVSPDATNLTIDLEGGTAGSINLDSLVLKNQLSQNIVITGDSATVTKNCGEASDCNTFIVTYRNLAANNDSVAFSILNGATTELSFTETTNPNDFTYIFDSTDLNFNADILTLRLVKTRDDGDVVTETIYFTPAGDVGFLDPTLVLIFSFLLFIGGITLVSVRFLLGWFGLMIGLVALTLLSFSIAFWWVTFMQGVMLMMMVYMGIAGVKSEGVL